MLPDTAIQPKPDGDLARNCAGGENSLTGFEHGCMANSTCQNHETNDRMSDSKGGPQQIHREGYKAWPN